MEEEGLAGLGSWQTTGRGQAARAQQDSRAFWTLMCPPPEELICGYMFTGTSGGRGSGGQYAGHYSQKEESSRGSGSMQRSGAGQVGWEQPGSGWQSSGWTSRRGESGFVTASAEAAQSRGSRSEDLNDGWNEWSDLAEGQPTYPSNATSNSNKPSAQQAVQQLAETPSSTQDALLGKDVDIITGQRMSPAQVIV